MAKLEDPDMDSSDFFDKKSTPPPPKNKKEEAAKKINNAGRKVREKKSSSGMFKICLAIILIGGGYYGYNKLFLKPHPKPIPKHKLPVKRNDHNNGNYQLPPALQKPKDFSMGDDLESKPIAPPNFAQSPKIPHFDNPVHNINHQEMADPTPHNQLVDSAQADIQQHISPPSHPSHIPKELPIDPPPDNHIQVEKLNKLQSSVDNVTSQFDNMDFKTFESRQDNANQFAKQNFSTIQNKLDTINQKVDKPSQPVINQPEPITQTTKPKVQHHSHSHSHKLISRNYLHKSMPKRYVTYQVISNVKLVGVDNIKSPFLVGLKSLDGRHLNMIRDGQFQEPDLDINGNVVAKIGEYFEGIGRIQRFQLHHDYWVVITSKGVIIP